jgi:hypothetical protein
MVVVVEDLFFQPNPRVPSPLPAAGYKIVRDRLTSLQGTGGACQQNRGVDVMQPTTDSREALPTPYSRYS